MSLSQSAHSQADHLAEQALAFWAAVYAQSPGNRLAESLDSERTLCSSSSEHRLSRSLNVINCC